MYQNKDQIILNDQIQDEIIKSSSNQNFNNEKKIYSSSITCTTTDDIIKIEAILRIYYVTPQLILKGAYLIQATSICGFINITIDSGNCQENRAVYPSYSICLQCDTNYVIFKNGYVNACPLHSAYCIDYADIVGRQNQISRNNSSI
ncbi:unnamed protein product [Paramecium pentaurelia]|uniref:Uncharacterized protein n=1 Tax=Paramecium pentaurelia TaxID=43138 RepID=A0A8S1YI67_9CILI|nr:unnamed protein product [Paramecium pentaurelia]